MKRLLESVVSAFWVLRCVMLLALILITWVLNPLLALLRVKTPIRRWLVRQWDWMTCGGRREW